jgi:uncharacterized spore protein YtfJ
LRQASLTESSELEIGMTTSTLQTLAPPANGTVQSSESDAALRRVIDQFATNGKADVAFGTPHVIGDRTLIPVARVMYGFGGGAGTDTAQQRGSGAGGGLAVRPFALIEATPDKVRVVPIVDVQRMIGRVIAFATVALVVAGLMRRPHGDHHRSNVKIGRIEPHFSLTSTPTFRFHRAPSGGMLRKLVRHNHA